MEGMILKGQSRTDNMKSVGNMYNNENYRVE